MGRTRAMAGTSGRASGRKWRTGTSGGASGAIYQRRAVAVAHSHLREHLRCINRRRAPSQRSSLPARLIECAPPPLTQAQIRQSAATITTMEDAVSAAYFHGNPRAERERRQTLSDELCEAVWRGISAAKRAIGGRGPLPPWSGNNNESFCIYGMEKWSHVPT